MTIAPCSSTPISDKNGLIYEDILGRRRSHLAADVARLRRARVEEQDNFKTPTLLPSLRDEVNSSMQQPLVREVGGYEARPPRPFPGRLCASSASLATSMPT